MANSNSPYGFKPVKVRGIAPTTNTYATYSIASAYSTSLFAGDPVAITGTADTKGRPNIQIKSTAGAFRGVFGGCQYVNASGEQVFSTYWPASTVATDVVAYVYDDPDIIFSIQNDETMAVTDIGNKVDYVSGTGSASTGLSAYVLDTSNIGTGDALIILALDPVEGNEMGAYAKAHVLIREHELRDTIAAV